MLSEKTEQWLSTLPTDKIVHIVPFDTTAEQKYKKVKRLIQEAFGEEIAVVHRGSTSLGISGQDEIDVYVPCKPGDFDTMHEALIAVVGKPRSVLPLQRIRFELRIDGKRIDFFLSNKEHEDWINGVAFEEICKKHPKVCSAYDALKQECHGLTIQDFYRRKAEFIDATLKKYKP